jgi:GNAT superfamily N-acetyltransferase
MEVRIAEIPLEELPAMVQYLKDQEVYDLTLGSRSGLWITYYEFLRKNNNQIVRMWVAFDTNDEPIGVTSIEEPNYYNGVILNLFVKPKYRCQGIGTQLLAHAVTDDSPFVVYYTKLATSLYNKHRLPAAGPMGFTIARRQRAGLPLAEIEPDDSFVYLPT